MLKIHIIKLTYFATKLYNTKYNYKLYFVIFILFLLFNINFNLLSQTLSNQIIQLPSAVGKANNLTNKLIQNPAQNYRQNKVKVSKSLEQNSGSNYVTITTIPSIFNLDELAVNNISSGLFIDTNQYVNFSFSNVGSNIYNQFSINLSYAYLFNNYTLGIAAEYDNMSIQNYNRYNYFGVNLGMIMKINENYDLGIVVTNLNRDYFGDSFNNVPQRVIVGIGGEIIQDFFVDIDALVNIQTSNSLSLASKYNIKNIMSIGLAFNTNPQVLELRTSTNLYDNFDFGFNLSKRNELGYLTIVNLNYSW
ncbi:MAG: hypothetical protein ACOVNU_02480 [Candidatus Kapaibacteriota bacterium]|jgi:hypothetical protein